MTGQISIDASQHWILDGFPRTLGQGKLFDSHLRYAHRNYEFSLIDLELRRQGTPLSLIVNLDVADEIILSRISDRWVHLSSGRVYNLSYNPPKVAGLDDETGDPLTKRPDDNPVFHYLTSSHSIPSHTVYLPGNFCAAFGEVLRIYFAFVGLLQYSGSSRHEGNHTYWGDLR